MGTLRSEFWVKYLSELRQTHTHREPRAQLSADMSASHRGIGVAVIPN